MWTGYPHLSCSAFTSAMIWNGHNTLMQSRLSLHRGWIFWDNWNVPERPPAICCVSTAQSSGQCWICESSLALQPDRVWVWRSRVIAEASHERCFSWLRLYDGVNYRWCRHAPQSSRGTHSAFLYPTDTCWTRHPVFTTCCHQSEMRTLLQNLQK